MNSIDKIKDNLSLNNYQSKGRYNRGNGTDIVIVDYMSLMNTSGLYYSSKSKSLKMIMVRIKRKSKINKILGRPDDSAMITATQKPTNYQVHLHQQLNRVIL